MADLHIGNVQLLIHADDGDGVSNIVDSSNNGFVPYITSSSVQTSTARAKFGVSALAPTATREQVTYRDDENPAFNAALTLGTGDYTIEGWIWLSSTDAPVGVGGSYYLVWTGSGLGVYISNGSAPWGPKVIVTSGISATRAATDLLVHADITDQWVHIAADRHNGDTYVYVDGVVGSVSNVDATDFIPPNYMYLGSSGSSASLENSSMDDIRITVGVARYQGTSFTPPTEPYDDPLPGALLELGSLELHPQAVVDWATGFDQHFKNVILLLHGEGVDGESVVTDSSRHALTHGTGNTPPTTSTDFVKFGATSLSFWNDFVLGRYLTYDTASGSYLEDPAFFLSASEAITFECFLYVDSSRYAGGVGFAILSVAFTPGADSIGVATDPGTGDLFDVRLHAYCSPTYFSVTIEDVALLDVWTHIAVVRNGDQIDLFVNGVGLTTPITINTNYSFGQIETIYVGGDADYNTSLVLDEVRVTTKVARYWSDFTPPVAAFYDKGIFAVEAGSLILRSLNPAPQVNTLQLIGHDMHAWPTSLVAEPSSLVLSGANALFLRDRVRAVDVGIKIPAEIRTFRVYERR